MTYDEWVEKHKPIKNHIDPNYAHDGTMFETFGSELDFIHKSKKSNVWTLVSDDDDNWIIITNYHYVNRLGYFVTELPWEDENMEIMYAEGEDEEDDN